MESTMWIQAVTASNSTWPFVEQGAISVQELATKHEI